MTKMSISPSFSFNFPIHPTELWVKSSDSFNTLEAIFSNEVFMDTRGEYILASDLFTFNSHSSNLLDFFSSVIFIKETTLFLVPGIKETVA